MQTREQYLASQPRPDRLMTAARPRHSVEGQAVSLVHEGRLARIRGDVTAEGECARSLDDLLGARVDGLFIGGSDMIAGRVTIDTMLALRFGPRDDTRDAEIAARVRAERKVAGLGC